MAERLEGSGASKMVQVIKKFGFNQGIDIKFGTVVTAPPSITVKIDNDSIEYDKDDLLIAEHLTAYKRKVKLTPSLIEAVLSSAGNPSHTHSLTLSKIEGDIEITDQLKAGDRVLVVEIFDGQMLYVLDKVVKY